jgi:hypothetical protein
MGNRIKVMDNNAFSTGDRTFSYYNLLLFTMNKIILKGNAAFPMGNEIE